MDDKIKNNIYSLVHRYDEFSANYEEIWQKLEGYSEICVSLIKKNISQNCRVLDVGCGTGYFSRNLNPSVTVFGSDISSKMILEAKRLNVSGHYFTHNYYEPFQSGIGLFNLVICLGSLDFCEDITLVLNNFKAILKENGKIILNFIDKEDNEFSRLPISPERMPGVDLIFYSKSEIQTIFNQLNIEIIENIKCIGYYNQFHSLSINYQVYVLKIK